MSTNFFFGIFQIFRQIWQQISGTTRKPPFYGTHTSLYGTNWYYIVEAVERAAWLRRIGEYAAAKRIFDEELRSCKHLPLVALEEATLYQFHGMSGPMWSALDIALQEAGRRRINLDLPEWRLIAMMRATSSVVHKGNLEPARTEMPRMRKWFTELRVPIDQYTDIQTSCVRFYILGYLFLSCYSNYNEPEAPYALDSGSDSEPWLGVRELRKSLCSRRMLGEMVSLLFVETLLVPPRSRLPYTASILRRLSKDYGFNENDAEFTFAEARLYLHCADLAEGTETVIEYLNEGRSKLRKWCEMVGSESYLETHTQWLEAQFLEVRSRPASPQKYIESMDLYSFFKARSHSRTTSFLDEARKVALELQIQGEKLDGSSYFQKYIESFRISQDYETGVTGATSQMLSTQYGLLAKVDISSQNCRIIIEWINGFITEHPDFSLPALMISLVHLRTSAYKYLGDTKAAARSEVEGNKYLGSLPDQGSSFGVSITLLEELSEYLPEDDFETSNRMVREDWSQMNWSGDIAHHIVKLMAKMAEEDLVHEFISPLEVHLLFDCECECRDNLDTHADWLGKVRSGELRVPFNKNFVTASLGTNGDDLSSKAGAERLRRNFVRGWLQRPGKSPRGRRLHLLFNFEHQCSLEFLQFKSESGADCLIESAKRAIDAYEILLPKIGLLPQGQKGHLEQHIASAYLYKYQHRDRARDEGRQALKLAEEFARSSKESIISLFSRGASLRILSQICLLKAQNALNDNASDSAAISSMLCHEGMDYVKEIDSIVTLITRGATWSTGRDAVEEVRNACRYLFTTLDIDTALGLLKLDPGLTNNERIPLMWDWVQRYKARNLNYMLSERLQSTKDLKEILHGIDMEIENSDTTKKIYARLKRDRLLNEEDSLKQLLAIGDGSALRHDELLAIARQAKSSVVFVDWMMEVGDLNNPESTEVTIMMLTVRVESPDNQNVVKEPEFNLDMIETGLKEKDYLEWATRGPGDSRCINLADRAFRDDYVEKFGHLIAPLAERSKPEDLLVFCPTKVLHRFPLHALCLPEDEFTPLIHRNPIVYNYSHTLLRSTNEGTLKASSSSSTHPPSMLFCNGIHTNTPNFEKFEEGHRSINMHASRYSSTPLVNDFATKEKLLEAMHQSRLIHIHTHCNFSAAPLEHSLTLPKVVTSSESEAQDSQGRLNVKVGNDKLTAGELLQHRLQPGTHVNMIACGGALAEIGLGDEFLGLVPAMLIAGASSTIATLWPIQDETGAKFAKYFWSQWDTWQRERRPDADDYVSNRENLFDMARALQRSVQDIEPFGDEPLYHWAGFILHGFWMFAA